MERQLQSTNHLKKKYLKRVNEILENEAPKVGSKQLTSKTEYVITESSLKSVTENDERDQLVKSRVTEIEGTPRPQHLDDQFSPTEEHLLKKQARINPEEEEEEGEDKTVRKLSAELDEDFDGPRAQPSKQQMKLIFKIP